MRTNAIDNFFSMIRLSGLMSASSLYFILVSSLLSLLKVFIRFRTVYEKKYRKIAFLLIIIFFRIRRLVVDNFPFVVNLQGTLK